MLSRYTNFTQEIRPTFTSLNKGCHFNSFGPCSKDGKHAYRLYNLREDIGESKNLASTYPKKVEELDKLITDYIADANVVVPLPNPKFDTAKFDPSTIGVQPGGLKMPRDFRARNPKPVVGKPASSESMQGWVARNADATVANGSLRISPAGRQAFIANAKMRASGPADVRLRIRTQKEGVGRIQWRTEGQEGFPKSGQSRPFEVAGGDWQELTVPLDVKGRLIHLRILMPDVKRPTEIEWIEIRAGDGATQDRKRWDFTGPAKRATPKQK